MRRATLALAFGVSVVSVADCGGVPAQPASLQPVVASPSPRGSAPTHATVSLRASLSAEALPPRSVASAPAAGGATPATASASDWMHAVPAKAADALVGDHVWAAYASPDRIVHVEPCRVTALGQNVVTVEDENHVAHAGVPGALVHRAGNPLAVKVGDVVTSFDWRHDLGIAVVTRRDPWARLVVKFRDSQRVAREEPANAVELLRPGVVPLAWVAFARPAEGVTNADAAAAPPLFLRGFVFAVADGKVFVRDDAGLGWVVSAGDVKPLVLTKKVYAVGDEVTACDKGHAYARGKVTRVFAPGFAYAVQLAGEDAPHDLYFSDFVEPL